MDEGGNVVSNRWSYGGGVPKACSERKVIPNI